MESSEAWCPSKTGSGYPRSTGPKTFKLQLKLEHCFIGLLSPTHDGDVGAGTARHALRGSRGGCRDPMRKYGQHNYCRLQSLSAFKFAMNLNNWCHFWTVLHCFCIVFAYTWIWVSLNKVSQNYNSTKIEVFRLMKSLPKKNPMKIMSWQPFDQFFVMFILSGSPDINFVQLPEMSWTW